MDLVTEVPHLPQPGETVLGDCFSRYPGGKGANQAVAAARLGGEVSFYGKIGKDPFGKELLRGLEKNGIDTEAVEQKEGLSTGIASIWVSRDGENIIALTPGANTCVDLPYIDRVLPYIVKARILLLQLEIPVKTVAYLLEHLPKPGPLVVLDPAPAQDLSLLPLEQIDILTPNKGELITLTGEQSVERAARKLLDLGMRRVVCKAGEEGSYLIEDGYSHHFSAFTVAPLDTTAAGDAFNGALAWALAGGSPLSKAIEWANAAGALTTIKKGAQPSLPTLAQVEEFKLRSEQR